MKTILVTGDLNEIEQKIYDRNNTTEPVGEFGYVIIDNFLMNFDTYAGIN